MKHLRVTAQIDHDHAPPFYTMLSDSPAIEETRLLEWNTTAADAETVLFAIRGDATPFATDAPGTRGIDNVQLSAPEGRWTYALVEVRPVSTPLFDAIRDARTRRRLVVRKPIIYRDGDMHFRIVGDATALQTALDAAPPAVDAQVERIEPVRGGPDPSGPDLSQRQRDALETAHRLGYYERPRGATHEDVADELGCAPATASEHLQKAEATVVEAVLDAL
ncbi:helix-turn-helix domain-containing protein [Halomicrobium sp. LC1Hm]|uniref:helix-turn-helix domain-containing protein n=1 Tax=Halomicrobium sp. LC1Hm TaxID=2610902 RepID=UPI0012A7FCBF|nr:helix-turn-helix domain-containing protein [Halomicrobium sp. LC1Hm]QGA81481.1 Transcriptional regulator, contains HTH domain [Halomicrobium sp. LC1Hm]